MRPAPERIVGGILATTLGTVWLARWYEYIGDDNMVGTGPLTFAIAMLLIALYYDSNRRAKPLYRAIVHGQAIGILLVCAVFLFVESPDWLWFMFKLAALLTSVAWHVRGFYRTRLIMTDIGRGADIPSAIKHAVRNLRKRGFSEIYHVSKKSGKTHFYHYMQCDGQWYRVRCVSMEPDGCALGLVAMPWGEPPRAERKKKL